MSVVESASITSLRAICMDARRMASVVASRKGLSDDDLLASQTLVTDARRALDTAAAALAGEIAYRSRRELGYSGLAQRQGFRTAEKLLQHSTGSTARDASTLVAVGKLVLDADPSARLTDGIVSETWLEPVGAAVRAGTLSVQSAHAIRTGIGRPSQHVTEESLAGATTGLVAEAAGLDADQILVRARQLRDDLDIAGVAVREQQIHDERTFRRVRRANGLHRYILDPDIETAAFLDDLYDRVTTPRRGNVTFISESDQKWAEAASGRAHDATDTRTVDQYVHDAITDLLRIAVATDTTASRALIGSRQPAVRVLVTADALSTGVGVGHVEGVAVPISLASVERIICAAGTIDATFDEHGNGVDLGREQRLFTGRQRILLGARDGGCRMPECDRPPGWCEAHHIDHWQRDAGATNLDRGVLLCRHHHMLMHNNGWEVTHDGRDYALIPPPAIDPVQTSRPMPSKSHALRDLLRVQPA